MGATNWYMYPLYAGFLITKLSYQRTTTTPRQPPRRSTLSRSTLHDDREEPWPQGQGKERSVYSPIGSAISAAPASPASGAPAPPAPPRCATRVALGTRGRSSKSEHEVSAPKDFCGV